jgi:hypothetical protein
MPDLADPFLVSRWIDTAERRIVECPGGEAPPLVAQKAQEETAPVGFFTAR